MIPTEAYPLTWPARWPRTKDRQRARFSRKEIQTGRRLDGTTWSYPRNREMTIASALDRLRDELRRFGAESVIVSSNVETRLDGEPRSGRRAPDDPGVAVYFRLKSEPYCLPCDRWDRVADNIAAVAAHVGAMRGMERWGVGKTSDHFAGFKALPPAGGGSPDSNPVPRWDHVLGVAHHSPTEVVQAAYRALASKHHPDKPGGDAGAMAAINRAFDDFKRERGL